MAVPRGVLVSDGAVNTAIDAALGADVRTSCLTTAIFLARNMYAGFCVNRNGECASVLNDLQYALVELAIVLQSFGG